MPLIKYPQTRILATIKGLINGLLAIIITNKKLSVEVDVINVALERAAGCGRRREQG